MNDLLNEDEFLPKEYNPWKWFYTYSLLAFGINIGTLLILNHYTISVDSYLFILIFSLFIIPVLFSILASLYPKQQRSSIRKTRSLGIGLIYCGNFASILLLAILVYIRNNTLVNIWLVITIILCLNMISYSIITTILNAIAKVLNKTNKNNERPA